MAAWLFSGCSNLPGAEGTRCREPDSPCVDQLGCIGGVCLALTGGPVLCESHDRCREIDPRRPYCVGIDDDQTGRADSYRNNFCAGCGADTDCEDAVCVQGETNWYCIGCLDGSQCDTGRCTQNICRSCKSDAQCAKGSCVDGRCISCSTHADCPDTGLCRDGVCRSCKVDSDCCQGTRECSQWRCQDRRCTSSEAPEK